MRRLRRLAVGLALALASLLCACQIGPNRLKMASSHYSDAVRVAASEELLVNLVRMRYRDVPTFLSVSSISTQFELEGALDVDGEVVTDGLADSVGIGAGIRYAERPTITFGIQGGEAFQKRMLRPISIPALVLIAEAGWRADRFCRLTLEKLNGLPNAPRASGPTPTTAPRYERFVEAVDLIRELGETGLIDFEYETREELLSPPLPLSQVEGDDLVQAVEAGSRFRAAGAAAAVELVAEKRTLVLRFFPASAGSEKAARLRELLRLDPERNRFDVVASDESDFDVLDPGAHRTQLALDTRSLMGVLYYLSNGVEAPAADLASGRATVTVDQAGEVFDWARVLGDLFQVRMAESRRRPPNAYVAVRHRGRWFYVDDSDQESKASFLLLGQLFSLQAGDVPETRPVLTLPVGGS